MAIVRVRWTRRTSDRSSEESLAVIIVAAIITVFLAMVALYAHRALRDRQAAAHICAT